jgi:hypothetical protein
MQINESYTIKLDKFEISKINSALEAERKFNEKGEVNERYEAMKEYERLCELIGREIVAQIKKLPF